MCANLNVWERKNADFLNKGDFQEEGGSNPPRPVNF